MERALHTRLKEGAEEAYDRLHQRIPGDLVVAMREAGVREWRIWRNGRDVFHLVDVEDYAAMRAHLRDHPANVAWQAQVTPLQSVVDDYSGTDDGLPFVWSLSTQWSEAQRSEAQQSGSTGSG